jgi:uncharacterized C2H2 Zn-finger protein
MTATVGFVRTRKGGTCISSATLLHRGELVRRVMALWGSGEISGTPPTSFSSVCVNVDYGAKLHTDSFNEGQSWAVALGDYEGGELWVQDKRQEAVGDDGALGTATCIRLTWLEFNGKCPHSVTDFIGTRISLVFFNVPSKGRRPHDVRILRALGFPAAFDAASVVPWGLADSVPVYKICICSTRRADTIMRHTLSLITSDPRVLAFASVVICVRDDVDLAAYAALGVPLLLCEGGDPGLPSQRRTCLRGLPPGSWVLFVDDDCKNLLVYEDGIADDLRLHDVIVYGFMSAAREGVSLWGTNCSQDARCLRPTLSRRLGLVCGYFFGLVLPFSPLPRLVVTDALGGASEDVERSLRHFVGGGVLRLCFVSACAAVWSNAGGLQAFYGNSTCRRHARDFALTTLCQEFPHLLRHDPSRPNGCSFRRVAAPASVEVQPASHARAPFSVVRYDNSLGDFSDSSDAGGRLEEGAASQCSSPCSTLGDEPTGPHSGANTATLTQEPCRLSRAPPKRKRKEGVADIRSAEPEQTAQEDEDDGARTGGRNRIRPSHRCSYCENSYRRNEDLQHHVKFTHCDETGEGKLSAPSVPTLYPCPSCQRLFRKKKDALTHLRNRRCGSLRGRHQPLYSSEALSHGESPLEHKT